MINNVCLGSIKILPNTTKMSQKIATPSYAVVVKHIYIDHRFSITKKYVQNMLINQILVILILIILQIWLWN